MNKIIYLLICVFLLSCQSKKQINELNKKHNVLFIIVDDLRTELNCYGKSQIISPNIDKLANNGLVFNRAYVQNPVCGASRCSILSGLRPTANRFWDYKSEVDTDAPNTITLPQVFKENGYYTLSNGKIFHNYKDSDERSWSEPAWFAEDYAGRAMLDEDSHNYIGGTKGRGPFFECSEVPDSAYVDGKILSKSIKDLKRLSKKEEPFFLAVGFLKPHLPFYAPKKYWDYYDEDSILLATNRERPVNNPSSLVGSPEIRYYHGKNIEYNSNEFHKKARHGYYACVSYTDALVGKLLAELEKLGLSENTIVVLIGDHGWHLGEHNFWGKQNTLHNAINSTLIIKAPDFKGNVKTDALVEFVDIYPTLCELTDIVVPDHVQGTSFVPIMQAPNKRWKDAVFTRHKYGEAVVTEKYTYTKFSGNGVEEVMLYDLEKDTEENINVVNLEAYKTVVNTMSNLLNEGYVSVETK